MSEGKTVSQGHSLNDAFASISECVPFGMVTLRGDMGELGQAIKSVADIELPDRGCAVFKGAFGVCWMSPDELLFQCPLDEVAVRQRAFENALAEKFALAVDISDARVAFEVKGPFSREVIAKVAPVDVAPEQFEAPMFRRTRFAQVPAAMWMSDPETFCVLCFRSQAQYVFDLLNVAAQPGSSAAIF